jgi:hypothetical protein
MNTSHEWNSRELHNKLCFINPSATEDIGRPRRRWEDTLFLIISM